MGCDVGWMGSEHPLGIINTSRCLQLLLIVVTETLGQFNYSRMMEELDHHLRQKSMGLS